MILYKIVLFLPLLETKYHRKKYYPPHREWDIWGYPIWKPIH